MVANATSLTITRSGRSGWEPCCADREDGDRIGWVIAFEEERRVTSTSLEKAVLVVPASREEAVKEFGDGSGVTVLAGGTILMPEINYGRQRPERVLWLQNAGLAGISHNESGLRIGAMTPVAQLENGPEPLASTARQIADPEVRAQATLGGNLCAPPGGESPRGDLQAALIAIGADVRTVGKGGERTEPIEDFVASGPDGRLVLEVELEEPTRAGSAAVRRPHSHAFTILAVCAAETSKGIRIGVTGGGAHGMRARSVEQALAGGASTQDAAEKVLDDVELRDDALASAWYRRRTLPVLVRRALDNLEGGE
jgi:CO/xanthine dehydrogenase FAD-binding subunit